MMMEFPAKIIDVLNRSTLDDIVIMGYIENDNGVKNFTPVTDCVFLKLGKHIVRCKSIGQHDKLAISLVPEVSWAADFEIDEDDELCTCSVLRMFTRYETRDSYVIRLRAFFDEECDLSLGIVKSLELWLSDKAGCIFLDPTHILGIKIGSADQRNEWLEDNPFRYPLKEYVWEKK
jgi:hypothetical protein